MAKQIDVVNVNNIQGNKLNLYIKTYGCQMNVYDSERMIDLLSPHGYKMSDDMETANLIILNTCNIREKAAEKVYSELGRINILKKSRDANNPMIIAVAGCVSQAEGDEIFRRAPYVDIVVGPQSYHTLPELITKVRRDFKQEINLDFPVEPKFDSLPENQQNAVAAFLSVQEGCDKFCTFCCVPYTRGAEYSRNVSNIYREAVKLVARGSKEINLLGQNVNAYHGKDSEGNEINLGKLIEHLAKIEGLEQIRYTTSHPLDMHEDLYLMHKNEPKLLPYLHLPVQSGSNKILKAMNRKHTTAEYLNVIERLRNDNPDFGFSSDFIVGFPGETDKDFEDTLKLVEQVGYYLAYSFKYSPRAGTPAAASNLQIPENVKDERLQILQKLLRQQQDYYNEQTVGKVYKVLFEKDGKYENQYVGKNQYMQAVHVFSDYDLKNQIHEIKILEAHKNSLVGILV